MKMRKGYSAIALLILCASCRLPRDATQWRQLPPGATVLVEPPPNPRIELVWSEAMISSWLIPPELQIDETKTPFKFDEKKFHDWLKGSPTGNSQNCMPQLVHWLDPSGTFQTREWEPFGFNPILRPKQHADASCWQDGPVLDIYLEANPVYLYRQRIYHFHIVDDAVNGTPCKNNSLGNECDGDYIRVCRSKKQPLWEEIDLKDHITPCTSGQAGGKNTTGPNGCTICVMRHYNETPG